VSTKPRYMCYPRCPIKRPNETIKTFEHCILQRNNAKLQQPDFDMSVLNGRRSFCFYIMIYLILTRLRNWLSMSGHARGIYCYGQAKEDICKHVMFMSCHSIHWFIFFWHEKEKKKRTTHDYLMPLVCNSHNCHVNTGYATNY